MAFNVGDYIKETSKSAVTKLVDNIVGGIVAGLPTNTQLIATSISQSLINSGSSYRTADALTSLKTDNVISGAANEFFALAGKDINRAAGTSIAALRRGGTDTINSILTGVNPETKIASKRGKDDYEILSVI